jgi:hypothetical protein
LKRENIVEFRNREFVYSGGKIVHVVEKGDRGRVLGIDDGVATISLFKSVAWIAIPSDYDKVCIIE